MHFRERSLFMDTPARAEGGGRARKFSTRFRGGRKNDEFLNRGRKHILSILQAK